LVRQNRFDDGAWHSVPCAHQSPAVGRAAAWPPGVSAQRRCAHRGHLAAGGRCELRTAVPPAIARNDRTGR